jgi:uncharacterized protein YhbP (UPF0306 family)
MNQDLIKIENFLNKHHVLTLATTYNDEISACSLFYAYSLKENSFVVASSEDSMHIRHILKNNIVAGNILLETKQIGKIEGVQFRGVMKKLKNNELKRLYFNKFPYSIAMHPTLWQIDIDFFKLTDNKLGFGKKIIWSK